MYVSPWVYLHHGQRHKTVSMFAKARHAHGKTNTPTFQRPRLEPSNTTTTTTAAAAAAAAAVAVAAAAADCQSISLFGVSSLCDV